MNVMIRPVAAILLSFAAAALAADAPAPAPATQAVAPDLSTPKGAVQTYLQAMHVGDVATARSAVLANDAQLKAIDAGAALVRSWRALGAVATRRFGAPPDPKDDPNPMRAQDTKYQVMRKQVEDADVQVEGDRALLRGKGGVDPASPVAARRQPDGTWRVEFDSMPNAKDPQRTAALMTALAKAADDTAAALNANPKMTPEEARALFGAKSMEAVKPYVSPATTRSSR